MALGSFRHLMINVGELAVSRDFYEQVLGFLNYKRAHESSTYCMWNPVSGGCSFGIWQTDATFVDAPYQREGVGFQHLAFNAENRQQIDDLYQVLLKLNATVLDPPCECPEYSPTYYAVYFEDPDGLKLEVAHS